MTPKEKCIRLAEAEGWCWYAPPRNYSDRVCFLAPPNCESLLKCPNPYIEGKDGLPEAADCCQQYLPDYLGDPIVMRRFLLSRDNFGFQIRYVACLRRIVLGNSRTWQEQRESFSSSAMFLLLTATLEQMADAALAAL